MRFGLRTLIGGSLILILFASAVSSTNPKKGRSYASYLDLEYANVNGLSLRLDLYVPDSIGPFPVIVWIHGGGWDSGDKSGPNPALRELDRGYAVASINYRLQITHPAPIDPQLVFPVQISDCKAAIRWLRANAASYNLSPQLIAAWGESAGGHLASLLGTTNGVIDLEDLSEGNAGYSSRVQAVVDWYGPTDFLLMDSQAPPGCPDACHSCPDSPEARLLGCPSILDCPEQTERANPAQYVTTDDPPFLIMHGTADCVVAPGQSQLLYDALQQAGLGADLQYIQGAGHGGPEFSDPAVLSVVDTFLDLTLVNPSCTYAFAPTGSFFPQSGGAGSVRITVPDACSWNATSNANWIQLVSDNSGSGNGWVSFEVRENFSGSARSTTLSIPGFSYTVVQDAGIGNDCVYSIFPSFQSFSASGGSGTVQISTVSRCAWQAVSNTNWITITAGAVGIGNGIVGFTVSTNSSSKGRVGRITIAGQEFTVKQKGG